MVTSSGTGSGSGGVASRPAAAGGASSTLLSSAELLRYVDTISLGGDSGSGGSIFLRYTRGLGPAVGPEHGVTVSTATTASSSGAGGAAGVINAVPRTTRYGGAPATTSAAPAAFHVPATTMTPGHSRQIPISFSLTKGALILAPLVGSNSKKAGGGPFDPLESTTTTDYSSSAAHSGGGAGGLLRYPSCFDTRRPSVASTGLSGGGGIGNGGGESAPLHVDTTQGPSSIVGIGGSSHSILSSAAPPSVHVPAATPLGAAAEDGSAVDAGAGKGASGPSNDAAAAAPSPLAYSAPIAIDLRAIERVRCFPSEIEIEARGLVGGKYGTEVRSAPPTQMGAAARQSAASGAPSLVPTSCLVTLVIADPSLLDLCYRLLMVKSKGLLPQRSASATRSASLAAATVAAGAAPPSVAIVSPTHVSTDYAAIIPGQPLLAATTTTQQYTIGGDGGGAARSEANHYHDPTIRSPDYTVTHRPANHPHMHVTLTAGTANFGGGSGGNFVAGGGGGTDRSPSSRRGPSVVGVAVDGRGDVVVTTMESALAISDRHLALGAAHSQQQQQQLLVSARQPTAGVTRVPPQQRGIGGNASVSPQPTHHGAPSVSSEGAVRTEWGGGDGYSQSPAAIAPFTVADYSDCGAGEAEGQARAQTAASDANCVEGDDDSAVLGGTVAYARGPSGSPQRAEDASAAAAERQQVGREEGSNERASEEGCPSASPCPAPVGGVAAQQQQQTATALDTSGLSVVSRIDRSTVSSLGGTTSSLVNPPDCVVVPSVARRASSAAPQQQQQLSSSAPTQRQPSVGPYNGYGQQPPKGYRNAAPVNTLSHIHQLSSSSNSRGRSSSAHGASPSPVPIPLRTASSASSLNGPRGALQQQQSAASLSSATTLSREERKAILVAQLTSLKSGGSQRR